MGLTPRDLSMSRSRQMSVVRLAVREAHLASCLSGIDLCGLDALDSANSTV
jgi:hypothetical protein